MALYPPGSWTSPQLAATAAYVDPNFQQKGTLLIEDYTTYYKSIVSLAALLAAVSPELQLSEAALANLSEATIIDRDNSGTIAVGWHKNLVEAFTAA